MNSSKFSIDAFSFWIGAAVASAFWLLLKWARPSLEELREKWQKKREESALRTSGNIEANHRNLVLKKAQGMHLASPLFSLEEVLIPPLFLAPPTKRDAGEEELFSQDQTNLTIPYLPQDSTLASFYHTATLSLPDVLLGGSNLVIIGEPGVGKTVALAQAASLIAKGDSRVGALAESIPFLLHVADLNLPDEKLEDILSPITEFVIKSTSLINPARLPEFVNASFSRKQTSLLLDGLDEIPPQEIEKVVAYIEKLLKKYPKTRIILTGSLEYLDKLTRLNFTPLTLRTWNTIQQERFLSKWGNLWENTVALETWAQTGPEQVDSILLNSWLSINSTNLSPLEFTLKTWGAYAGDGRGASAQDAIDTHIRRLSPENVPTEALDMLAMQASLTLTPIFDSREAREWVKDFELLEETPVEEEFEDIGFEEIEDESVENTSLEDASLEDENTENEEIATEEEKTEKVVRKRELLEIITESGLLVEHSDNRMRFAHPVFAGYLAGKSLSNYAIDERLTKQPRWSGKKLSMHYFAINGTGENVSSLVETLLRTPDPILERNIILMGNWLKDAPRKSVWRGKVLTALAKILQDDTRPLGLRGQIISALARSEDPSVAALFRQLLKSDSVYAIQLAALGSGIMRDKKAVQPLTESIQRLHNTYSISAAALALSAIGTDEALNTLATALMQGEENLRRATAEAFANHPAEGWGMLKEALEIDDILVRRSAIYGLARIEEPWAKEILAHIQVEDKEWAVRDIATDALEKSKNKIQLAPHKLPPPSKSPWLIAFAGEQGMGIPAGSPATELLLLALKDEDTTKSLAALAYLVRTPNEGIITALYHAMYSKNIEMREAIFLALVEIAASGIKLPEPRQFGLA